MTEMHPPAVTEAILESFGADPEFCDAVIGDLAQEYALRAERFGATAARLWYYKEAALAAPALIRNWLAGAGFADARRLLNVSTLAYVTTVIIGVCLFFGVTVVVDRFTPGGVRAAARWINVLALFSGIASPIIAGYLAATFEESRPMIAALSVAVLWACFMILGGIWSAMGDDPSLHLSAWTRLATAPFMIVAYAVGGALRVARVARAG